MGPPRSLVKNECSFPTMGRVPRVTDAQREQRREQIVVAARRCFAHNGFHQTSMPDILEEAGVSAGTFYRYFRSKDDVIALIAEQGFGGVGRMLEGMLAAGTAPTVGEILEAVIAGLGAAGEGADDQLRTAIQGWGEALRNEELRGRAREGFAVVGARVSALVELSQDAGRISRAASPEQAARVVLALIPGFILQRALLGPSEPGPFTRAVAAVIDGD